MRRVVLKQVHMMGFKSFVDPGPIKLSSIPGFKSLTGDNQQEPRLGANGAGKSSFLDAIFWCCYGSGLKGQRASSMASWGLEGVQRPFVICHYLIDKKPFSIKRVMSPEKLFINEQPAEQAEVDRLLGLTKARFRHSIIFGQNVEFFAQLSIAERSALMEEVCDLSIWQRAIEEAEVEAKLHEGEANVHKREILRFETRLEVLPRIKDLRQKQTEWHDQHRARVGKLNSEVLKARKQLEALGEVQAPDSRKLDMAQQASKEAARIHRDAQQEWEAAAASRKALHDEWKHLKENPDCPKCGQRWPNMEKRKKDLLAQIEQASKPLPGLTDAKKHAEQALENAEALVERLETTFREKEMAYERAKGEYDAQARLVRSLEKRLLELKAETDADIEDEIAEVKRSRAHYREQITVRQAQQKEAEGLMAEAIYWKSAFRQVRLFQMKRVLKHLELEIEAAMNSLGLHGWKIGLATETENKSGTFKQGVQIQVTSPKASAPWESWSGGEGQRLTLAIAIGFANMIKRMSGVSYGFEFWDEPSAWLSAEGIEDLTATLRDRAEQERLSLWLVDHRSLDAGFDETWIVRKNEETSWIERA